MLSILTKFIMLLPKLLQLTIKDTLVIYYLKKSVSTSVSDAFQKTESSLELADIYFDDGNYQFAQAYYDTASMSLPQNYPDYTAIMNKTKILSQLVDQIQTITLQDSLQTIAKMNTADLYAMIDKLIEEYDKKQKDSRRNRIGRWNSVC